MTTEATGNSSVEAELLAEISRLRAALKGPEGFATWEEAFHAERLARVRAEQELFSTQVNGQDGWVLLDLATQCAERRPATVRWRRPNLRTANIGPGQHPG